MQNLYLKKLVDDVQTFDDVLEREMKIIEKPIETLREQIIYQNNY